MLCNVVKLPWIFHVYSDILTTKCVASVYPTVLPQLIVKFRTLSYIILNEPPRRRDSGKVLTIIVDIVVS